ncbi:MAG: HPr family phosphocarrier protein [candidate division KSB1 bacterium]|nr:HPr family phosphocarrier protein [candidate division KSB1 bacterium]MDZ7366135.1 HPr family phosphocarrier protein [candidate division KSB1 bacterium]MDZ7404223.1 HPr family phosphocarrier protein [candidate division KSB1 bacterium]
MVEKKVTVLNKMGLHARPSSKLVQRAAAFKSDVHIRRDNQVVNGKSIMGVMMLAASQGTELIISANGVDEEQTLAALVELFEKKFEEE